MISQEQTMTLARTIVEARAAYEKPFKDAVCAMLERLQGPALIVSRRVDVRKLADDACFKLSMCALVSLRMDARDVSKITGIDVRSVEDLFRHVSTFLERVIVTGKLASSLESDMCHYIMRGLVFTYSRILLKEANNHEKCGEIFVFWDMLELLAHTVGRLEGLDVILNKARKKFSRRFDTFLDCQEWILPMWVCLISPHSDLQEPSKSLDLIYRYVDALEERKRELVAQ